MAEQLFARLQALRQRVRQLLWMHGACWLVGSFLATAFVCGLLDWLFRIEDTGIRCVMTLLVVVLTGFAGWRFLVVPLLTRLSDLDLALRIERRFPELRDSLASAVQFLQSGPNELVGSIEMQQATISHALDRLRRVSPESMIELKPVKQAGLWAGSTAVVCVMFVSLNWPVAALAFQRLAMPLKKLPWPRQHELRFVTEKLETMTGDENNSLVVAQGETVPIYVENTRGALPKNLTFEARVAGQPPKTENMRQTALWDAKGKQREIGTVSLPIMHGPIVIRAFGGDGETESFELEVVEPPRVQALFVKIIPPAYSGLPERALSENVGHVESLVGSQVKIEARSSKRLKSATLQIKDGESLDLVGTEDARGVSGEFTLTKPGSSSWWLTLQDEIGFDNVDAPRYDLRGIADLAPEVRIEKPVSDQFVTPNAKIPFSVSIRDDLAIKSARLSLAVPVRMSPITSVPDGAASEDVLQKRPNDLRDGADSDAQRAAAWAALPTRTTVIDLSFDTERPKQLQREHELDLAEFTLDPGMRLVVHGEATDYYDLGSEHVGRSLPRTLTIITPAAKQIELQDRQQALVLELERVQRQQAIARAQIKELQLQVENAGLLRPADLDTLKRVELDQKQVNTRLASEADGVAKQARMIRTERSANQVSDPKSEQLLQTLAETIDDLAEQTLLQLQRELSSVLRTNLDPPKSGEERTRASETKRALDQVGRQQDDVLKDVGKVLDQFQEWKRERNLAADLRELSTEQQRLTEESTQLGQQTVSKSLDALSPQQKAELLKLAERQQQMASRVEKFSDNLKQKDSAPKHGSDAENRRSQDGAHPDDHSDEQRALDDVQQQLTENKVASKMRQAAGNLSRNQISEAVKQQEQLTETLRKLQDTLDERDVTDQESLVKKLGESVQELDQLRQQQDDLLRKVDAASKINDQAQRDETLARLKKEQEQLRKKTDEVLKKLQKLDSRASRQSAQRAVDHMQKAEEQLQQGDAAQAKEEQREALDDLEQAEREAATDKQQAELELAQEVIERIADQLKSLRDRQQAAVEEGARLQTEFKTAGKWSRSLLKSARTLGQAQRNLAEETRALAKSVQVVEVLTLALDGAARLMEQAAEQLDLASPNTDDVTLLKLKRSKQRFDDLLAALDQKHDEKPNSQGNSAQENATEQAGGPPGENIPIIAQLQVIRTLQADLIARVEELETARLKGGDFSDMQLKELETIADEQSRLADLVRELTEFFGDAPLPRDESDKKPAAEPEVEKSLRTISYRGMSFVVAIEVAAQDVPPSKPQQPPKSKSVDDELLEKFAPDIPREKKSTDDGTVSPDAANSPTATPDELNRTIESMRAVSKKLLGKDLSDETRKKQQLILSDIDKLIEKLKQPTPLSDQSSDAQQHDPNQQDQQKQKSKSPSQNQQPQANKQQPQGTGGVSNQQKQDGKAGESSDKELQRKVSDRTAEIARRRVLIDEVWGHLPPAMREQMLNATNEKMLPQYEQLIRDYYESLARAAEERRRKSSK